MLTSNVNVNIDDINRLMTQLATITANARAEGTTERKGDNPTATVSSALAALKALAAFEAEANPVHKVRIINAKDYPDQAEVGRQLQKLTDQPLREGDYVSVGNHMKKEYRTLLAVKKDDNTIVGALSATISEKNRFKICGLNVNYAFIEHSSTWLQKELMLKAMEKAQDLELDLSICFAYGTIYKTKEKHKKMYAFFCTTFENLQKELNIQVCSKRLKADVFSEEADMKVRYKVEKFVYPKVPQA